MRQHIAEYVSPGHPDRLCDAIVETIVQLATDRDPQAFVAVECAMFNQRIFVDGRIAAGRAKAAISINDIVENVHKVFREAGFGAQWHPHPSELQIDTELCLEPLSDEERQQRIYADDQNVVTGYAYNCAKSRYLPPVHYIALQLGQYLRKTQQENSTLFGPDFKLLLQMQYDHSEATPYHITALSVSIQHSPDAAINLQTQIIYTALKQALVRLEAEGFDQISQFTPSRLTVNGFGEFTQGGPLGDNGLSGKKLVIDYYGPDVAIGGGAICGKDRYKIDVCGAFFARSLAIAAVQKHQCLAAHVHLGWSPGEEAPSYHSLTTYDRFLLPHHAEFDQWDQQSASINSIQQLVPRTPRNELMLTGYFAHPTE